MENNITTFIKLNSPDGALKHSLQGKDFLQSDEWRKFQESVGRKTYNISSPHPASGHPLPQAGEGDIFFHANIIEHTLPIVGKYFYIPRGPVVSEQGTVNSEQSEKLIVLAKKNKAGWIRIEPATSEILSQIKSIINATIKKAPHDMQPREILIVDISKTDGEILAAMKQKTRYNIKLAQKKSIEVFCVESEQKSNFIDDFVRLVEITSKRNNIVSHPEEHYRVMFQAIPDNILQLYIAQYQGKTIAANVVAFFGGTATYLHGASDDAYKNLMAPYLLQWQQIMDAKARGCEKYDFGGVKINLTSGKSWAGVTRFKTGFSPNTKPTEFPGSYDIIISSRKYWLYRSIQRLKNLIK